MVNKRAVLKKAAAIDLLMLCFSFSVSLTGQMFKALKDIYGLSLSEGGLLLSAQSIGGLAFAAICILVIDAFSKAKTLVIMGIAISAMLALTGIIPPLFLLFAIFAALGFSGAAVNSMTNSVMIETAVHNTARYVGFMHFVFSFGAVTAPILSQSFFMALGLSGVYLIFGGFALCCAAYAVFAFRDQMRQKLVRERISLKDRLKETAYVIKRPGVKQIFVITVLVCSWQLSAVYYISTFFTGINSHPMDGALALSVLFLGMMVSRLAYSRIADRFSRGRVLMITNGIGLLAWVCVFLVPAIPVKMVFLGLAAVACGNNMPIVFTSACMAAPKNMAAASGIVVLGYYIAVLAFIPLIGSLGDAIGLAYALLVCTVPLLLIIPFAHLLHIRMHPD